MRTRPMILVTLVSLLLLGVACSDTEMLDPPVETRSSPIVGGTPTADYASSVALYDGGSLICSGTLVSPHAVITAAHCLDGATGPMQVFFGINALKPWKGTVVAADDFMAHPDWNPMTLQNDIGVVRLAEPAPVDPAPLLPPGEFSAAYVGEKARFLGFGAVNWIGQGAGIKRQVDIELIQVTPTTFKYADPTGNTCFGDSGGGGFVYHDGEWKLAGVTSYGDQWCQIYGVSTRGDAYLSWLATLVDAAEGGEPDGTELVMGQQMSDSVAAGEEAYFWFPTFDNQRYDVYLETVSGDVDLYVGDDPTVSQQNYTCAPLEAAGEPETCTIADGGNDDNWLIVKGNTASLFRLIYVESDSACHAGMNGEAAYCTEDCPCTIEEGDCQGLDDMCVIGLRCDGDGEDVGLDPGTLACKFPSVMQDEGPLP